MADEKDFVDIEAEQRLRDRDRENRLKEHHRDNADGLFDLLMEAAKEGSIDRGERSGEDISSKRAREELGQKRAAAHLSDLTSRMPVVKPGGKK